MEKDKAKSDAAVQEEMALVIVDVTGKEKEAERLKKAQAAADAAYTSPLQSTRSRPGRRHRP
jgi:hypothetical protein